ncbi:MAG TPA: type VI secretion system baseplate subunit TssK, partial [Anaeromyxobacter sp.]
ARVGAVAPDDWGVLSIEVDAAALAAGQVKVARFAGVLPDGLPVGFDEADGDAPPPRPLADHFPPTARSVDVHVAVARQRDGVPAYAEEGQAQRIRFVSSSRPVEDATAPGQQLAVALARPNATLLFGDEAREDFETIKVAEVGRSAAGQPALVESYVPPALKLGASPWLLARTREVLTRVVAKQRELSEGRRQRDAAPGELSGQDLSRLLQLFALNGQVPLVAHLAEAADESPRTAYLWLSALAGQLSTFSADSDPATLPKFSHVDLRATFEPLFARLGELLGALATAQYIAVPLEQRAGGLHLGRMQDERVLQAGLFLMVKSDLPEQQVADAVPRLCKIASTAEIQGLVQAAAPGLQITWLPRPPPQLPARTGTTYFAVAKTERFWQSIATNRNLAIYLPPPFDPAKTKVELAAVPGAEPPGPQAAAQRGAPAIRRF